MKRRKKLLQPKALLACSASALLLFFLFCGCISFKPEPSSRPNEHYLLKYSFDQTIQQKHTASINELCALALKGKTKIKLNCSNPTKATLLLCRCKEHRAEIAAFLRTIPKNLSSTNYTQLAKLYTNATLIENLIAQEKQDEELILKYYPACYRLFYHNTSLISSAEKAVEKIKAEWKARDHLHARYFLKVHPLTLGQILTVNCTTPECKLVKLYEYVTNKFSYLPDPPGEEIIQSPEDTLRRKTGDCEDLAILFVSLAEGAALKPYLAFTEHHVFAFVCGVNTTKLAEEIKRMVEKKTTEKLTNTLQKRLELDAYSVGWFGYRDESYPKTVENESDITLELYATKIAVNYSSTESIYVYVVPTEKTLDLAAQRETFPYACSAHRVKAQISCAVPSPGGVLLRNPNADTAKVKITARFEPEIRVKKLAIWHSHDCIALELTAGPEGWPGWLKESDINYKGALIVEPATGHIKNLTLKKTIIRWEGAG